MPSVSLNPGAGATCVTAESPASENHSGSCGSNKGPISTWRFKGNMADSETATLQSLSQNFISLFPHLHQYLLFPKDFESHSNGYGLGWPLLNV